MNAEDFDRHLGDLAEAFQAERALADDLAAALNHILFEDGGEMPEVERMLARYREARQR